MGYVIAWRQARRAFEKAATWDSGLRRTLDLIGSGWPPGLRSSGFWLTRKQRFDRAPHWQFFEQHAVDSFGDGHTRAGGAARASLPRAALTPSATWPIESRIAGSFAASEREPDAPVARQIAGAGQRRGRPAGQPPSASSEPPVSRRQARGLGQSPRDQRRPRVVGRKQALSLASRGDREHRFRSRRRLPRRPCRRCRRVRSVCAAQDRRQIAGECNVGRRDHQRRRQAPGATSSAKLGPETTPIGAGQRGPSI